MAIPRSTTTSADRGPRSSPCHRMIPARGRTSPAMVLKSVLLPAPLPPTRATSSPGSTLSVTPESAGRPPSATSRSRPSSRLGEGRDGRCHLYRGVASARIGLAGHEAAVPWIGAADGGVPAGRLELLEHRGDAP